MNPSETMRLSKIIRIAKVCHNVNKAYCETHQDFSQPSWENAPRWHKDTLENGVKYHLDHDVTPEQSHENWMQEKVADGWVYGEVKDTEAKTHPCILPYSELPEYQLVKDALFKAVVDAYR